YVTKRSPESKVICANSTPMYRTDRHGELDSKTDRVRERNRIMQELATKHRFPLNDLFNCVLNHVEYYLEDGVHFTADGQNVLSKQVARAILELDNRKT
ncbi:MAG: SGNH/GDSL hydrolase family protein, partial [Lentisphaerae bacterium]|nr:SGNH/GDSL hydrolase family protein [Lentisphaerota bacterium]